MTTSKRNTMGGGQSRDVGLDVDHRLRMKFLGGQVTTVARLVAYREADETSGLTEISDDLMTGHRSRSSSFGVRFHRATYARGVAQRLANPHASDANWGNTAGRNRPSGGQDSILDTNSGPMS